tara:strand:- start:1 stop:747 length:747 start_codon:yes stop_codon:yes gene_type:complete
MSEILDFFADNPEVAGAIAKSVPAIMGIHQANKAKNAIQGPGGYQEKLENLEKNRQQLVNPYATITNPFQNLQVATKAAEMQADQSDLALANTLDVIRKTGAGGATALAQAALKSKQGIAASIEKQQVQNQRLAAQGELRVQQLRARGEFSVMSAQERREEAQLDRLQGQIDLAQQQRAAGSSTAAASISSALGGLTSLINPQGEAFITGTAIPGQAGYGETTPEGTLIGFDSSGNEMSFAPGFVPGD